MNDTRLQQEYERLCLENEHLKRCLQASTELQHDILDTAMPHMDLSRGTTVSIRMAWEHIKENYYKYNDLCK